MDNKLKYRISKLLLNDYGLFSKRNEICDALELPFTLQFQMERQYKDGTIQMYELIRWMLNEWHAKNGNDATIDRLKQILSDNGCKSASLIIEDNIDQPEKSKIKRRHHSLSSQSLSNAMNTRNLVFMHCFDFGQFGDIYKAKRLYDSKEFSIKRISVGKFIRQTIISSDGQQNHFHKLLREIQTMAKVNVSPHIVSFYDAWFEGPLEDTYQPLLKDMHTKIKIKVDSNEKRIVSKDEDDTYFCILMELCEKNLEIWMDITPLSERKLEFIEGVIIKQILIGLNYMHSRDIAHRDLKPKNILMIEMEMEMEVTTFIKIGDLGLAREIKDNDTSTLTKKVGFRDFRSPEMERGDDKYDVKTDIFSLGLIYLVLIHDFKSTDDLITTLAATRRGNLEVVGEAEEIHKRSFPLLRQMLERKAENRPDTVQALDLLNKH